MYNIYGLLIGPVGLPSLRSCSIANYTALSQPLYAIHIVSHATSLLCTRVIMLALDLLIIHFMKLPVDGYPKNRKSIRTVKSITSSLHCITETLKPA